MKRIYTLFIILAIPLVVFADNTKDSLKVYSLDDVIIVDYAKAHSPLHSQPASYSTISTTDYTDKPLASLKEVSQKAPNFFMPDYGSRLTSAIYIRGIGSRINNPAVGLYVDDIPFNDKSAFDFKLNDIARIEILRGPQGTLYGRNTMGGLIRAYTRSPLNYSGTDVHLGYASGDNHRELSFTHYHHPIKKLAWYIGGYYEGSDGFFENDETGKKVDDMQAAGGRIRALYLPSDRLKFDLNINFDHNIEGAYPYYYKGAVDTEKETYRDLVGKITNNRENSYRRNVLNIGLNTQYKAERLSLSNVTGFQSLHDRMYMDQDFLHDDIYTIEQKQKVYAITDEITLKNKHRDFWNWVSGANVMYQSLNTTGPVTFMQDGVSFLQNNINGYLPKVTVMGMEMPMEVKINDERVLMGGDFDTPVLNAALFHQSELWLTGALKLSLGLRLDYEHNALKYNAPGGLGYDFTMTSQMMPINLKDLNAAFRYDGSLSNDYWQLMPKFAMQYFFGLNKNNVYATISRGTRSGGYNVQMFSDLLQGELRSVMMKQIKEGTIDELNRIAAENPRMPQSVVDMIAGNLNNMPEVASPDIAETVTFKPEYSWNYEVGTHLTSGQYSADAAVFLIDTRDQQIARFAESGLGRMMANAGHSQSRGAEVTLQGEPVYNLRFALNYGYTYAVFKDYDTKGEEDYSGNHVPFVPKHTVNLDASYTHVFHHTTNSLTFGATYSGAGRIYWTENNTVSQPYYSTLAARIKLQIHSVQIELWGRNLTDTKYDTFYFETMSRGFAQKAKPLQVGIDLRWHF